MIFNVGAEGVAKTKKPPLFDRYHLDYTYAQSVAGDGTVNWEMAITSTQSDALIRFDRVVPVDIFLVGGGASGGQGYAVGDSNCHGGDGGKGGSRVIRSNVQLTEGQNYSIYVGQSDQATTFAGYTANSGAANTAGTGGDAGYNSSSLGTAGSDGEVAFYTQTVKDTSLLGALNGRKYGAGGGGAPARSANLGEHTSWSVGAKAGGATGGGTSGTDPTGGNVQGQRIGYPGQANTGAGGGGSCGDRFTGSYPAGAAGGSGIIIIRNAR